MLNDCAVFVANDKCQICEIKKATKVHKTGSWSFKQQFQN